MVAIRRISYVLRPHVREIKRDSRGMALREVRAPRVDIHWRIEKGEIECGSSPCILKYCTDFPKKIT